MPISTFERNATIVEMAIEIDRRGAVIEALEAQRDMWKATAENSERKMWDALRAEREAEAQRDRLMDRLEMRHAYDGEGNRIAVEPGSIPDGIECRDDTIKLQDERIARLEAQRDRLRDALRFYAERVNYVARSGMESPISRDQFGGRARAALEDKPHE